MRELRKGVLLTGIAAVITVAVIGAQLGAFHNNTHKPALAALQPSFQPHAIAVNQIADACRRGDLQLALALTSDLPDSQFRSEVLQIVSYSEARSALAQDDLGTAERAAGELPYSLKRSLVLIAVASRQAAAGDNGGARRNLRRVVAEYGQITPSQRMRLLAMSARVYLMFDPQAGQTVLQHAVIQYRAASRSAADVTVQQTQTVRSTRGSFYEVLRPASGQAQVFSLSLPGLPGVDLDDLALQYLPVK